ncbi:MAG: phosphoenolpyruvate synthase [Candidatus Diapherotrites archaeon]|nr:phosphoenolpyruvate synthase [Candidatus Diapherotrites archaeon]
MPELDDAQFGENYKPILWFINIHKEDIPFVGGKGSNLGEMTNADFPIPPGFCITAQAYFAYLQETGLDKEIIPQIDAIDVENTPQLEETAAQVRQMILNKPMSKELEITILKAYAKLGEKKLASWVGSSEKEFVAVRSSATAEDLVENSFAGQQESFLNVLGDRNLIDAVKKCWASLFTARAVYYRKKNNFSTEKVGISVVVQKMVNSESAGVMFTSTPTGDQTKIVIEAAYGLGEAVVSGSLTPDTYTVDKGSVKILNKRIVKQTWAIVRKNGNNFKEDVAKIKQDKQKIDDKFILDLARIGKQIEQHYGRPQDIEWAFERKILYIVQSRAITTLKLGEDQIQEVKTTKKPIVSGLAASPGIVVGIVKVIPSVDDIERVVIGDIIATTMTTPDWVPAMRKAKAIITDEGGSTCHAAIVSRELGIPCVVGTSTATKILKDGEEVTVDGFNGTVYKGKVELEKPKTREAIAETELIKKEEIPAIEKALIHDFQMQIKDDTKELKKSVKGKVELKHEIAEDKKTIKELQKHLPEETERKEIIELLKKRAIKVKVNVALPEAAIKAAETGADGVGLLRAEHMITASGIHPIKYIRENHPEELVKIVKEGIKKVASLFKDKPVWYRTFDARTDEFRHLKGGELEPHEDNPMLGWHGVRRGLDEPELIKAEFKAIKELVQEGFSNIGVMLPFVQAAEEVKQAKALAKSVGLEPRKDAKFGVMIETPGAVWSIDELIAEGIDFISFGTNDLTQLTLGLDRNNEKIQKWFTANHPAIMRQLQYVISKCRKAGVTTSICGQAASDPEIVKKLIGFGIDSVSANIDAVKKIKETVLLEQKRILMEQK